VRAKVQDVRHRYERCRNDQKQAKISNLYVLNSQVIATKKFRDRRQICNENNKKYKNVSERS